MQPYGGDRVREAGGKIILHSRISKGWTPRRAKNNINAEFPGTAVLWDEQYFEVIAAELLPAGGIRYVLEPWRDDHTIRVFDLYDDATEARRLDDFRRAHAQQKKSAAARFSSILLGHLPAPVQRHLENELGVTPPFMTLVSCLPSLVLLGICVWLYADARLKQIPSAVPVWLWFLTAALMAETAVRFHVAMLQNRGMGTFFGWLGYTIVWLLNPNRSQWLKPFEEGKGHSTFFTLPPPEDVALRDSLELRGPWLTLLSRDEQLSLAARYGFDYRRHAFGPAWIILISSAMGAVSSWVKVADSRSLSAFISLLLAGALAIEQILRLSALRHGPAGSFLAVFVRPFMRRFLERG